MITLDTSAVIAISDDRDEWHCAALQSLQAERGPVLIPALIMAEVAWMMESRYGTSLVDLLLADFEGGDLVLEPGESDISRIRQLTNRYIKLRIGFSDSAVIACAERNGNRVLSFDRRHFEIVARETGLMLLPESLT